MLYLCKYFFLVFIYIAFYFPKFKIFCAVKSVNLFLYSFWVLYVAEKVLPYLKVINIFLCFLLTLYFDFHIRCFDQSEIYFVTVGDRS